jgi:DNA-binding transcriptional MerR regulator
MGALRIGDLADRTDTSAPTIRYYEQIGLLRRASRQAGNQRVYSREFDFSIEQVRVLVSLLDDPKSSCMDARDLAAKHLDDVRAKMRELKALERNLVSFVEACDTSCAGGPGPDCLILDDLGKHCGCDSSSL